MIFILAHCDLCDMDIPFASEADRDEWVAVHGQTPHFFNDNALPTITTRDMVR